MYTRPDFNLGLNAVGVQVDAIEKESPHQAVVKPTGAAVSFWGESHAHPRDYLVHTQC
jgi:hypothetical protein